MCYAKFDEHRVFSIKFLNEFKIVAKTLLRMDNIVWIYGYIPSPFIPGPLKGHAMVHRQARHVKAAGNM